MNKKGREKELTKNLYTEEVKREWGRLIKDEFHKLEFDTTLHFLKKYLPKTGLVLDAGGGPGRYTIELARKGYDLPQNMLGKKDLEKMFNKEVKIWSRFGGYLKQSGDPWS